MPEIRRLRVWLTLATSLLFAPVVHADDLTVSTLESGAWPSAVAALQADVHAEGRTVHVVVADAGGQLIECGHYTLELDEVSTRAFVIGVCDASTRATAVTLLHRDALFQRGDLVPTPRAAGITAVAVRTGGARGGAGTLGASDVSCSIAVRPFVRDMQHGTLVYLAPPRFGLHVSDASVAVAAAANGWTLRSSNRAAVTVEYEVTDSQSNNAVVVHERATLDCGDQRVGVMVEQSPVEGATDATGSGQPSAVPPSEPLPLSLQQPLDDHIYRLRPGSHTPWRGAAAPVVLISVFSDFQCPFCSRIGPVLEQLLAQYPGRIRVEWRDYPMQFHNRAMMAAEAAREAYAQQGAIGFWRYHDALFLHQSEPGGLDRAALLQYARELQMNLVRFRAALDQHTHADDIRADMAAADASGRTMATPTVFINGRAVEGAQPLAVYQSIVEGILNPRANRRAGR